MKRLICEQTLLKHAEVDGYPSYDFEVFYQQGLQCYRWSLPKIWRKQAFQHLSNSEKLKGRRVSLWQIRAFVYGALGFDHQGLRPQILFSEDQWVLPPDASWDTMICIYPGGFWEMDFAHRVSRRFWSEDNGFLDLPKPALEMLSPSWFQEMGFMVMQMSPSMEVRLGPRKRPQFRLINGGQAS
jgi:hypothetical protein